MLTEAEELELLELEEAEAKAKAPRDPMSPLKAGAAGAVEGALFGLGDEAGGAGAAASRVPGRTMGQKALTLATDPESRRKALADYVTGRNALRGTLHEAREDQPGAFFAGEIAGAAPTALIPGLGGANAAKMAALGALQGFGSSESDLTEGDLGGAAMDTAFGAGTGLAAHGAMEGVVKPVAGAVWDGVTAAADPLMEFLRRKGGQAVEKLSGLKPSLARMVRREGSDIFEQTKGTPEALDAAVGGIQDVITGARREAGENLGKVKEGLGLGQTLEQKATQIAEQGTRELTTPEVVRQALGALDPGAPKGPDSMKNLLSIRQSIDNLIDFSRKGIKPVPAPEEAVLMQLRGRINERLEGITAPTLERSAMGAESAVPGTRDPVGLRLRDAERRFAETASATEGLTPKFETTPKALSTVRTQMEEGLRSVDPDVKALEGFPGGKEALTKAKNEVARFLVEGADPEPGGGTAALLAQTLGLTPQRAARMIALLEGPRAPQMMAQYPALTKAAKALQQAAARGPQAVATTNYLLQQQDPEYRALMNEMKGTEGR